MKCNLCNEQANHKIFANVKGEMRELHLCKTCLSLYHSDVLQPYFAKCQFCNTTLDSIKCNFSFGCDNCLKEFQEQLKPLLFALQKRNSEKNLQLHLLRLKQELNDCVQVENYEQAAKLRDEIQELRK